MSTTWMEEVREKVADCWEWHSPALQIGFQFADPDRGDDSWEVWAYPAVQEIVGGKEDGETVWSGFNFDVLRFLHGFDPEAIAVTTRQHVHPSELTVEGKFRGKGLFLHPCLEPPDDVEPTEILDLSDDGGPVVRDKV